MQYAPQQKFYLADDDRELWPMPPIEEELELIRLYGSETIAITLNSFNLTKNELQTEQKNLKARLGLPVVCPMEEGMELLVSVVQEFITLQRANTKSANDHSI